MGSLFKSLCGRWLVANLARRRKIIGAIWP
ncbi:uncharacterized protein METZ01_LOCUS325242, partial [marine metagenome]